MEKMKKQFLTLDAKSLGAAIAALRVGEGLSQEDVAERLKVGQEAISRIERGVVVPSLQRLLELAEVFGCSIDQFILPTSARPADQATWLNRQLVDLSPADREFVVQIIEALCRRLKG